ncbi:unnamed protein product [Adineta steineri]|uniref:F-box domain-containing protein n=1 Tax=Adineta steineri TaxID=433720 RepID=A0A815YBK4_9BILA|nr:unnamed protein product [Adineta steineri]CAF1568122.1 unnamed protein product [Adineta steineri]
MSNQNISTFLTLPVELVYRILDHQLDFTILCSMRNVCQRFNNIVDSYDRYQTLTTLDLESNEIRDIGAQHLTNVLRYNTTLTTLSLARNAIRDVGAQYLADGLQHSTTLTTLNLGCNQIGHVGAQYLNNALRHNTTLTTLDLTRNEIRDVGAQYLSDGLRHNTTLTTLNLGSNEIGYVGTQHLSNALQQNSTLTTLNLGGNQIGHIGAQYLSNDDNGQWLIDDCKKSNIDINQLHTTDDKTPTSYTYVISVESTGRRTFFNQRGTNSLLNDTHFDFNYLAKKKNYNLFYLGYLTLLDGLDQIINNETVAAQVLKKAKEYGLETIIDFVSVHNSLYSKIAQLTLPYVDHLILNEIETGLILNQSFQQGTIEQIEQAARILMENYGVQRTVTIHFDRGAICVSRENSSTIESFYQGSLCLPSGYIKGAVGAGDAFAAGVIYGIYKKWSIQERLFCGICVAAMCLKDATSYAGVGSIEECLKFREIFCCRTMEPTSFITDTEN